jgi:homoserine O-acetyltransferase
MTGPDTRTTQVYINLTDNSRNDSQGFAPFGKVISGMDVVDKIYSGYGENSGGGMRAGRQDKLFEEGNAWLDKDFPRLTHLVRATILVSVEDAK